jgi:hypothetical protein
LSILAETLGSRIGRYLAICEFGVNLKRVTPTADSFARLENDFKIAQK